MRSRRQGVSDAVSVLGMDPWKDDRVRDFVAINTIQRLRAYHLPLDAPMPPVESVNADRALNLLLLPRAEPDYRPCMGERAPPPPPLHQARPRGREKSGHDGGGSVEGRRPSSPSPSSSSSASDAESEKNGNEEEGVAKTPRPQQHEQRSLDSSTPLRHSPPDPPVHSPEAVQVSSGGSGAAWGVRCSVDRARAVFFGESSFHSSTSPRRLVNSPHVPLTPSVASTSPVAERSSLMRGGEQPPTQALAAVAARSLIADLDAYSEAHSTPLRLQPPPPMPPSLRADAGDALLPPMPECEERTKSPVLDTPVKDERSGEYTPQKREADCSHHLSEEAAAHREGRRAATPPPSVLESSSLTPAHHSGVRAELLSRGDAGSKDERNDDDDAEEDDSGLSRSCEVCDAIIQYYQSMLTRGVVLDRYNHKDLAFAWWVLGRNMETAALEQRGPMRREALLITIRNLYYGLLSAEEAKAKAAAALAEAEREEAGETSAASLGASRRDDAAPALGGKPADGQGSLEAVTSGVDSMQDSHDAAKALVASGTSRQRGRGVKDALTSASLAPTPPSSSPAVSGSRKRQRTPAEGTRADRPVEDGGLVSEPLDSPQDDSTAPRPCTTIAMRAHMKLPPMPSARARPPPPGQGRPASAAKDDEEEGELPGVAAEALAAALREEKWGGGGDRHSRRHHLDSPADVQEGGGAEASEEAASAPLSLTSSATASRAGSVAPSDATGTRRHRRAEERRRAVEESWTSTRTNRRVSAAAAVAAVASVGAEAAARAEDAVAESSRAASRLAAKNKTAQKTGGAAAEEEGPAAEKPQAKAAARTRRSPPKAGGKASVAAAKRPRSPQVNDGGGDEDAVKEEEEEGDAVSSPSRTDGLLSAAATPREKGGKQPAGKAARPAAKKAGRQSTASGTPPPPPPAAAAVGVDGAKNTATVKAEGNEAAPASAEDASSTAPPAPVKKKEEHRGRPRGSFKIPRPPVVNPDGSTASPGAPAAPGKASTRSRDGTGVATASTAASSPTPTASASSAVKPEGASRRPLSTAANTSAAATAKPADAAASLPDPSEMPVGLTPLERAVRARVQQRMGVALPPPDAAGAPVTSLYSSYTFLLSCFAAPSSSSFPTGGGCSAATTAPVLWYGNAFPLEQSANAERKGDAVVPGPAAGMRGRKKRLEGGVDPAVLGSPLRHDQAALERLVDAEAARAARAAKQEEANDGAPLMPARAEGVAVKRERHSDDNEEESGSRPHADGLVGVAHSIKPDTPLLDGFEASPSAQTPAGPDTASHAPLPATAAPAPQPPEAFSELTYAQQCLLVWTAGGLLERHALQRHMAEVRRERLLARCGRMATRRMVARVAAVVGGSGGAGVSHIDSSSTSGGGDGGGGGGDAVGGSAEELAEVLAEASFHNRDGESGEESESEGEEGGDSDTASVSSGEQRRQEMRPLPRRTYDYWSMYRGTTAPHT